MSRLKKGTAIAAMAPTLVGGFEGLRTVAYPDPATNGPPWTVCYGHTEGMKPGDRYTVAECKALLIKDMQKYANGCRSDPRRLRCPYEMEPCRRHRLPRPYPSSRRRARALHAGAVMFAALERYLLPIAFGGGVLAGVAMAGVGGHYWQKCVHDPAIRKEAMKGYVAEAQLAAVQAKLDELQRQKAAGEYAHAAFARQVAADRVKDAAKAAQLQQENNAYAAALRAQNRACPLDQSDIDHIDGGLR
jgi:hypothetical protein